MIVLSEGGAGVAHKEEEHLLRDFWHDGLYTADEFRTKEENINIGQLKAIVDLIGGVTEVQRYCDCPLLS